MGFTNIHRMNGLKNWGGFCMNLVAALSFATEAPLAFLTQTTLSVDDTAEIVAVLRAAGATVPSAGRSMPGMRPSVISAAGMCGSSAKTSRPAPASPPRPL